MPIPRPSFLVYSKIVFLALSVSGFVLADKFQNASSVTKKDIEVSCDKYDPDIEPFNDNILIVIGPEGGISLKEEEYLKNNNFELVSFGNLVFRVETACIYIGSVLNYVTNKK